MRLAAHRDTCHTLTCTEPASSAWCSAPIAGGPRPTCRSTRSPGVACVARSSTTCAAKIPARAPSADALAPGWLLVGARGRLFRMCGDFQIAEPYNGFDAIGSGGPYALGALHATAKHEPVARIRLALTTAETFTPNVRRPFTVCQLARQTPAV